MEFPVLPRCLSAAILALSLALPSAAAAIPPPPPVAVVLVDVGGDRDASEHLLDAIGDGSWFQAVEAPVDEAAFAGCGSAADAEACVRGVLAQVAQDRPPVVVVLAMPGPGFNIGWRCVGPGEAATRPERQTVSFQTDRWDNRTIRYWEEDRVTAAGCILAAASESGW